MSNKEPDVNIFTGPRWADWHVNSEPDEYGHIYAHRYFTDNNGDAYFAAIDCDYNVAIYQDADDDNAVIFNLKSIEAGRILVMRLLATPGITSITRAQWDEIKVKRNEDFGD